MTRVSCGLLLQYGYDTSRLTLWGFEDIWRKKLNSYRKLPYLPAKNIPEPRRLCSLAGITTRKLRHTRPTDTLLRILPIMEPTLFSSSSLWNPHSSGGTSLWFPFIGTAIKPKMTSGSAKPRLLLLYCDERDYPPLRRENTWIEYEKVFRETIITRYSYGDGLLGMVVTWVGRSRNILT